MKAALVLALLLPGSDREPSVLAWSGTVWCQTTDNAATQDSEIGVPGKLNPNAGRITATAYGNADPQRNWQFAAKIRF